jgi:DHA2 family multidrug resistance protein-like MFS transporter
VTENGIEAGRREWIALAVLILPSVMYAMDLTVLYLASPSLSADLKPSSSQLLWIIDIYGFVIAGLLIGMGTLGDRIGRRRLLLLGAAGFGIASLLTAFSTSAAMLIAARALLGVSAATLAPSTLSLIRNMFRDDGQRTFAIGVWASSYSVGGLIAPLIGGILLEHFWWGSVFLLAVPVMVLLLILGPLLLPEYRDPDPRPFDVPSAVLSFVSVVGVIYGIKVAAVSGLESRSILAIGVGVAVGTAFVYRQKRIVDPMVDLRLFRAPAFSIALGASGLALFLLLGMEFLLQQYLQLVLGLDPLEAGLWLLPSTTAFITTAMLTPKLARHVRPGVLVAVGLAIAALGAGFLTALGRHPGVLLPVASWVAMAAAVGPVITLSTDVVVASAPPERAGMASGVSETGNELGSALGIALLGSIVTAVYRSQLGAAIPFGVTNSSAAAAKNSLGSAHNVAGGFHESLVQAANSAFTDGLEVAAAASGALMLGAAVVAWLFLVRRQASGGETQFEAPAPADSVP